MTYGEFKTWPGSHSRQNLRPMHKYQITIFWSEEDELFVAAVPDLPGCSALGDTHEEALVEAQVAISLWLDTAREFGHPIPAPASLLAAAPDAGS